MNEWVNSIIRKKNLKTKRQEEWVMLALVPKKKIKNDGNR